MTIQDVISAPGRPNYFARFDSEVARLKWRLPCRIKPPNRKVRDSLKTCSQLSKKIYGSLKGHRRQRPPDATPTEFTRALHHWPRARQSGRARRSTGSRHHAHIKATDDGSFMMIDGVYVNGQIKRSANKVYVNGDQKFEHPLKDGDRVTIGASTLKFEQAREERTADLSYDDKPLGHTQLLMSAKDVLTTVLRQGDSGAGTVAGAPRDKVLESLQRKANILSELYEMSKALGSGFDLDKIFKKATDIIFRFDAGRSSDCFASRRHSDRAERRRSEVVPDRHSSPRRKAGGPRAQDDHRPHDHAQGDEGQSRVAVAGRRR